MKPTINIKRAYAEVSARDGYRVLVDRLWPRGLSKEDASLDEWAKDLAPTLALRKWFGHDPERWKEFQKRYKAELEENSALADFTERQAKTRLITLVYGAKDEEHTHALVLQQVLGQRFGQ